MKGLFDKLFSKPEPEKPKVEYGIRMNIPGKSDYEDIIPAKQSYADEFFKGYKWMLDRDPKYKTKDLIEQIDYYKFYPVVLPHKFEGNDVYSFIERNKWLKVGTLDSHKREVVQAQKRKLKLYPNIYKVKRNGEIEEHEGFKYFGFPPNL